MTRQNALKAAMVLCVVALAHVYGRAQSLPRWPSNTHIQVTASGFDEQERERIKSAIEAWRPLLPSGLTLEMADSGNVTMVRQSVRSGELGQCTLFPYVNGLTRNVAIRIDPSAGAGDKFQRVVAHEIGHALGLDDRAKSVMTPTASDSVRVLFWKFEKGYKPDMRDAERLQAIYRDFRELPQVAQAAALVATISPAGRITSDDRVAPPVAVRYSFHRVVTIGKQRRESTFTFNDKGEQVETDIVGSNDKAFRSIPMFPVGVGSEKVFAEWWARPAVNQYTVLWSDGKSLSVDGTGHEALHFPIKAYNGKIRVEFSDYKLFRTSVTIKEVDEP